MSGYIPMPQKVRVTYPDVPSDLVGKLNNLITAMSTTVGHLNNSSTSVQTFMGQTNGAIQHVGGISQGKATQALLETWLLSRSDMNQSHTGMSGAASHLNTTTTALTEHLQTIKDGVAAIETARQASGYVAAGLAPDLQQRIDSLTSSLNNVGLALDGAAKLLNTLNSGWPMACATGFTPGGPPPSFAPNAFDNSVMHMSGNAGAALNSAAGQRLVKALGKENAAILIELLGNNANLDDVAALAEKGMNADEIYQLVESGKSITGAGNLLNHGIPINQLSEWVNQGVNLKGANALLNKGIPASAIDQGLSQAEAAGWKGVSNKVRTNMVNTIQNWLNGTRGVNANGAPYLNDGTPFRNDRGLLPGGPTPDGQPIHPTREYREYTVNNYNTGSSNELRIVVDKYGNMWYTSAHYDKFIPVPWSFILRAAGQ